MASRANVNGEHTIHPRQNSHTHHHNSHYYLNSSSAASFKGCCCCLFLLLTFLCLLTLAVILIILLVIKPKKPQFDLQQVNVQYVGITAAPAAMPTITTTTTTTTSATATTVSLSLIIRMVFRASNPNKVGTKYSETRFHVMYRGVPLGVALVPGFYQPANSVRVVETSVGIDRVNVMEADAMDLVKDTYFNDRAELRIMGDVAAKIRLLGFTSPRVQVSVDCAIVISPRKQSVTYKQCGVDGLNV